MTNQPEIPYLTQKKAYKLLKKAVKKRGKNYIYKPPLPNGTCVYVEYDFVTERNRPSCLIAEVLVEAGVPLDVLKQYNTDTSSSLISILRRRNILDMDSTTQYALREVQREQDRQKPWGEAIKSYNRYLKRLAASKKDN